MLGQHLESLHARGAEEPGHLHRARCAGQLQSWIEQRRGAQRGQVTAVERRARHQRQPAAGIEIADLRDVPVRLEQVADAAEEPRDRHLHLARRRRSSRARGQHRSQEQLGGQPLVTG